ncbi:MAG: pseudouridine synthase [Pseudomonadota bacterium]
MSDRRAPTLAAPLAILGEYRGLVFVDKPAGLQTEPDARTTDTLVSRLAAQLAEPAGRVHALSRLDTGVSGVVTLGLTPDARRMVQEWRDRGSFERRYLALAGGDPEAPSGTWRERIGRGAGNLRVVAGRNAELAHTDYAVAASSEIAARATPSRVHLLALAPRTGRTHQLRVHCAAHALPLLGDRAYGGASRLIAPSGSVAALDRIALHAAWVELPLSQPLRIQAPTPPWLLDIWRQFSGDAAAFAAAREVALGTSLRPGV